MNGKCVSSKKLYVQINERGAKRFVKLYKANSEKVVHHVHLFEGHGIHTALAKLFREATEEERTECAALSL